MACLGYNRISSIAARFVGILFATGWAVAHSLFRAVVEIWRFTEWVWQTAFPYPSTDQPVRQRIAETIDFGRVRANAYESRRIARLSGHEMSAGLGLRLAA